MTYPKSSALKEGAFWKERLPSFFLAAMGVLLLLSSCKSMEEPFSGNKQWSTFRGKKQMERIHKEGKIVFAVVKDSPEEKYVTLLAEKAASFLKLKLEICHVKDPGEIPSLLRSARVDFAWGNFAGKEEINSLYLLPLEIKNKEKKYLFALPGNGLLWKKKLQDALSAAVAKGGKDG